MSFDRQVEVTETIVRKWNDAAEGRIKMAVLTANEESVLNTAQRESDMAIRRAGLPHDPTALPDGFWGSTRLRDETPT